MINQGGERICTGLAEKGQAYPFKFPLLLYQKFEIQRRNYHLKSSHALYKKAGGTHIFILQIINSGYMENQMHQMYNRNMEWIAYAFCPI